MPAGVYENEHHDRHHSRHHSHHGRKHHHENYETDYVREHRDGGVAVATKETRLSDRHHKHHHAHADEHNYTVYANNANGPYIREGLDRDIRTSMETQLPPRALHSNLQTYTVSLKSHHRDFDSGNFPIPLRGRISPGEYQSHIEKVNHMMKERPRELGGMAKKADGKAKAWAAVTIIAYILLALAVIAFVLAFIAFWICLGIAVGDVGFDSWWWPVVLCGALWTFACFIVAITTVFVVFANQKWRKWRKVAYDEATLEKYHNIVRYLRRENERTFNAAGIVWTFEIPTPPRTYYYGWTKAVAPTLDIIVFNQPQPVRIVREQPAHVERVVEQPRARVVSQRVEKEPVRIVREGTTSSQSRAAEKEIHVATKSNDGERTEVEIKESA